MKFVTDFYTYIKFRFKNPTLENIIWILDLNPQWMGFSIMSKKNSVLFWVTHFGLMFYIFFVSSVIYQIKYAEDVGGIIQANIILSIIMLTANNGYWFLTKRSFLICTLKKVCEIDTIAGKSQFLRKKYDKLLNMVKNVVIMFYFYNYVNTIFIYVPQRMDLTSGFWSASPCPGIDVSSDFGTNVCRAIIFVHDVTVFTVVMNYQALLLFLIAHTAAMYIMLSEEMMALKEVAQKPAGDVEIRERLSPLITRHALLLDMIHSLKTLYSVPIGINFATNAYIMCLFFSLRLREWIVFAPMASYCFLVFFLYCYLSQKLIDASKYFENSVYDCGWEKYVLRDQKAIYIVLKLAQIPVMLLAGGIIPVNIYTFATAMQFIFKFVTVLKF